MIEKVSRNTSTAYGLSYAVALPTLVEKAREFGYALAIHGSMATDMDLIAVPWTEDAREPSALAMALRECVGGMFAGGEPEPIGTVKPHGRLAYTILPSNLFLGVPKLEWCPWIDLSITPKSSSFGGEL